MRDDRPTVPVIVVGSIEPDGGPVEFSNSSDPRTLVAQAAAAVLQPTE